MTRWINNKPSIWQLSCSIAATLMLNSTFAQGTAAGTVINNTAYASYYIGDHSNSIISLRTQHSFTISETINANVTSLDNAAVVVPTPSSNRILSWKLSNTGNGTEAYKLTLASNLSNDHFDPIIQSTWKESNNIPGWQSSDTRLHTATDTISLAADESQIIYTHCKIPENLQAEQVGTLRLTAKSMTAQGTLAIGDSLDNMGDHNTDAVFLITDGKAISEGSYIISNVALQINKTIAHVVDRYNSTTIMSQSLVTYLIEVNTTGSSNTPLEGVVITDKTPSNMHYVAGSIKLNGQRLTDYDDHDQADYNISTKETVTVHLGNLIPPRNDKISITYKVN